MGYMIAMGNCCSCRRSFQFNPDRVPSIRGRWVSSNNPLEFPSKLRFEADPHGHKEPVCKDCIELANIMRAETGKEPLAIPAGAYEVEECV